MGVGSLVGSAVATMDVSSAANNIAKHKPGKTSQKRQLREEVGLGVSSIALLAVSAAGSFAVIEVVIDILDGNCSN
jgi:hypothetical protein